MAQKKKKQTYAEFMQEKYGATNDYYDNVQSKLREKQEREEAEKKKKNEQRLRELFDRDEDIAPVATTNTTKKTGSALDFGLGPISESKRQSLIADAKDRLLFSSSDFSSGDAKRETARSILNGETKTSPFYTTPSTFSPDQRRIIKDEEEKKKNPIQTTQAIYDKYGHYYDSSDYDKYSKQGAAIKNPTLKEAEGRANIFGKAIGGKEVGNIVTYSRENAAYIAMGEVNGSRMVGKSKYQYMTDFEVGIYNYLLAKEGNDVAQEFLDDIEETLNARSAGQMAQAIQDLVPVASTVMHGVVSIGSGVESFGTGIKQLFSEEALPTTETEFLNQELLNDLDGAAKYAYQAGNTIGNMAPSVAASVISPTVGRILQGSSAAGNAYRESLKEGKTKEEAATYGVMIGSMEFLTSKLLSGVAGTTGDIPKKILSKVATFDNALLRVGAKYGVNVASEITEEELQLWLEPFARKIAFGEDYDAPTLEEMAETAIVTALSTGVLNATSDVASGNLAKVNGLTPNEAKVINKEVEKRIAEQEENGKKLTNKEKDKIYDDVLSDLDKGYISTDTIEETLGGDTYKSYKDTTESEDALKKELDELRQMKSGDRNDIQNDRLAELKAMNLDDTTKRDGLKKQLGDEVFGLVKDSRLVESYNERGRRSQAYQADTSKYDAKQQTVIQNAIDSGILNNTNRTHEFVDMIAKISADKGVSFDFTNNEKLKESGFAIDGKTINGYVTKDGVTLNIQSAKALNSVVGHETTHVLEGTELYNELQKSVIEYAKSKGDYQGRYDALTKLYEGIKDADIDAELTADLVGDYLFTDSDFINNLSTKHRNVFQKIYDEIKYLCKVATAGSKEARELERVKRAFAEAYRERGKVEGKSNTTYNLSLDNAPKTVYNDNRGDGYARTDEFRNLQAESQRMPDEEIQQYHAGREIDPEIRGRLSRAFELELQSAGSERNYSVRTLLNPKTGKQVNIVENVDGALFHDVFEIARKYLENGELVDLHAVETTEDGIGYDDCDNYLSEDGLSGFSITPDGDLISVFNLSDERGFLKTIASVVREKAKTLDCYASPNQNLMAMYEKIFSFKTASIMDYNMEYDHDNIAENHNMPKVAFMVNTDGDVETRSFTKDQYDEAVAYRNGFVDQASSKEGVSFMSEADAGDIGPVKYSLSEDIDTFDNSLYNEIELSAVERDRVQSEALTWHVANKGQPFSMPLSNGFTYLCSLDNDGIVHIYGKEESVNIHEFGGNYDNRNTERPDRYVEKFGNQQGIDTGDNVLVENGRDQIAPFAGNVATIQGKGRSHRAGYSKNDTYAHRNPKGWHFNDDGSVEVTYSDGTKETENAAPIKKTSSNDDVFFDASHDAKSSLSAKGETPKRYGRYNVYGKDIMLEQDVAPVAESVDKAEIPTEDTVSDKFAPTAEDIAEFFPSDPTLDDLKREARGYEERIAAEMQKDVPDADTVNRLYEQYKDLQKKIRREEAEEAAWNKEQLASLDDADVPPEVEAPYYSLSEDGKPDNPFENRDIKAVGNRKVKAYMYENPEVKPYFQEAANVLLGELNRTQKGERLYTPVPGGVPGEYGSDSYGVWTGVPRQTSPDIAYLLDELHYTYDEIEKGIKAIIEDNGKENNACSKRIEFLLNDRLLKGYPDMDYPDNEDMYTPPNQEYINLLNEKQITEYNEESFKRFMESEEEYAPIAETPAPVTENADVAPVKQTEEKPRKTAEILFEETEGRKKRGIWSLVKEYVLDNGMVFEDISKKHNRRELEARWNSIRNSEKAAQRFIKNGKNGVRSIETLKDEIEQSGLTEDFNYYMYHKHNVDRMSLESRVAPKIAELKEQLGELDDAQIAELAEEKIRRGASAEDANRIRNAKVYTHLMNFKNKAVFGDAVTAEVSQAKVDAWEKKHPEFKEWAEEVYANNKLLRQFMVDNGILSEETAELWDSLYPHYVPIRRKNQDGAAINVPLDTNKTGINAPIKRATGGDSDFYDLFSTMSQRAIQTYKAVAKNRFGTELLDVLGTTVSQSEAGLNDAMDSVEDNDGLLKAGKHGANPTFTIFEDGKRVEFEISEEMYDAMRPAGDLLSYTNDVANKISNFRRATLTEYSALFLAKNAVKDMQDVFLNSQHAVRTYGAIPEAIKEMATGKGQYIQEYLDNGGEANTYFDSETNSFTKENKAWEAIKTVTGLNAVQKANNVVEMLPRLAEYIASRKMGRSVDVSMLDAARVTTNFAAGGKLTKMLNRNGATFLNASVQGAIQQARNVREAKMNGLKGVLGLAAKVGLVGGTALLLNNLMWDDDEEYEELSDYAKQNYYIVGKFGDGKFVRIPKGRATAVIQTAFEQMQNLVTGNDEVDLKAFLALAVSNLAPNDPIDNNVLSPIMQVKNNETWYGEDLVPSRLQKLPDAEQYDETTDSLSKWLGEKLDFSPYKINYLLDQYSGFVGDAVLPVLTPEAESGDMPIVGDIEQPWLKEAAKLFVAPAYDAFTTDSTMKNQDVSDFYKMMDELTVGANASGATDEDILKSKYMNSINSELGELYAKKREIQNSNLSDAEKYEAVREVQKQITELAENSLNAYDNISIEEYSTHGVSIGEYANVGDRYFKRNKNGEWEKLDDKELSKFLATKDAGDSYYATDGENHYKWYEPSEDSDEKPSWKKISDDELERQEEVTSGLGISASDYWGNKDEYTYAYKYPGKYAISKAVGGYDTYTSYTSVMNDIGANNDSSSGVKDKDLITEYIFGLDLDYGEKIILYRSKYSSKADKNEYNADIVDYLNSRDDISYEDMVTILEELDMTVDSKGNVYWD